METRGEGVNKLAFWVTDNLLNDWIQLPDAQPHHIQAARMVKKMFTGNLNASVESCPPFPGKERHLLRAQLARIFHATAIVPKGLFEIDEETNEMRFAEEFVMPTTDELKSTESWSHLHPVILKAGRTTHAEPEGLDEEAKEEYMNKLAEEDKTEERFRTINEDNALKGYESAWISRVVGDQQQYNQASKEGTVCYAVNVLKSLYWPGAYTVAKGGKFTNIYVGYGMKRGDNSFNPTEPPMVQQDPQEQAEMPEPTPLNEPVQKPVEGEGDEQEEEA